MKPQRLTPIVLAVAVVALLVAGCHKKDPDAPHNPEEKTIVSKPFDVSLTEVRQSKTFTWTVDAAGATDNGEESIKELCVTKYNEVTLKATEDVNVKSDKPEYVSVTRVDDRTYVLEYKADGPARIQVWNGEGTARCERSFRVAAKECVDITGVKFLWYKYVRETDSCVDDVITISHFKTKPIPICTEPYYYNASGEVAERETENDFYFYEDNGDWDRIYVFDERGNRLGRTNYSHEMTFLGFEPENTSFRNIIDFRSEWEYAANRYEDAVKKDKVFSPEDYDWPDVEGANKDVDDFSGVKANLFVYGGTMFYMAVIHVKADVDRYYYLYHRQDGCSDLIRQGEHGSQNDF
ncbi:MAG: hypothetical protein K5843_05255 [Bacteroidales bacterium]|nr:hypothetical protein [Bacteroidales bacterium]